MKNKIWLELFVICTLIGIPLIYIEKFVLEVPTVTSIVINIALGFLTGYILVEHISPRLPWNKKNE